MTVFLITIAAVLRVFGSFHDGISARRVGWFFYHALNWARRDCVIAAIVWYFYGLPWESIGTAIWWIMWAGINILLHKIFYWLGEETSYKLNARYTY